LYILVTRTIYCEIYFSPRCKVNRYGIKFFVAIKSVNKVAGNTASSVIWGVKILHNLLDLLIHIEKRMQLFDYIGLCTKFCDL
jgi:hypothetical protein